MTPRLRYLLSKARVGGALWDIGCDHGLLAESALYLGQFTEVHFVDPLEHQIEAAKRRVSFRFPKNAYFHCAVGESISTSVTGSVVIAGMGGGTMFSILSALEASGNLSADRLILSPHKDVPQLQEAVGKLSSYQFSEGTEFIERGRPRPVLVYDRVVVSVSDT